MATEATTESPARWARSGEANIAYRTVGNGPVDMVFVGGLVSHLEVLLEEPGIRRWFERLGQISRVILMDRRGSGLSDPLPPRPYTLAEEVEDIVAVLDALGTERVIVNAYAAGGPLAIEFAALRPERTLALVLYAAIIRSLAAPDYPWASDPEERQQRFAALIEGWGTGVNLDVMAPSAAEDPRIRAWLGRLERLSMTPTGLAQISSNLAEADVRERLPHIRVPTLVLHRTDDQLIDVRHSRYAAEHIPNAKLVELPGVDSLPMVGDMESLLGEIEEFLTGKRGGGQMPRALLTILFTDICDATGHAARMGDQRWRDLLAAHDVAVRDEVRHFGGEEVKTVGDAFVIAFEGTPSTAVRCARRIVESVDRLGLSVRIGLHTGECELIGDDVGGMAVHIAARVGAMAGAGEVYASGTTFGTVVGSGLDWTFLGDHELKGVPARWPLFKLNV